MIARLLVFVTTLSLPLGTACAEPAKPDSGTRVASIALKAAPGATSFRIGNSGPSSGPNSASMLELLDGANLYFDSVNAQGGIKGRRIDLLQRDDNFEVPRTVKNVEKLIDEDRVDALLLVRGTPHNEAILPLIDRAGVPLIGPSTGAMILHKPLQKQVFNVRTAYRLEAQKLAQLLAQLGKQRIVVIHVQDSFGDDVAQGIVAGLAERQLAPAGIVKFDRKAVDIEKSVPEVKRLDPDAIVLIGAGQAVAAGVEALRGKGILAPIATVSNNASSGFIKSLGSYANGVMVSQVFPDERPARAPLAREASRLAQLKNLQLTPAMMEGFTAAKVTVEALRRCAGACSRADLHRALESLDLDLGGVRLAYSPTDHSGIEFTDLSIIDRNGVFRR
jgi:ABC-type branched-subunit amino acid transport system substrate-binding protein